MIKRLKYTITAVVAIINVITAVLMVAFGYSDRVSPIDYPLFSSMGITFPIFLIVNICFLIFWIIFKFRFALISVAGFIAACSPIRTYIPFNFSDSVPPGTIGVMSYNVKYYYGTSYDQQTFETIFNHIKEQEPDILCLQEDHSMMTDKKARYDSLYAYADTIRIGSTLVNVIGIYSKFPILRKERIEYKSNGNGSAAFYLKIGRDTVIVINNHLETTHLSKSQRENYAKIIQGEMGNDTARAETRLLFQRLADATRLRAPQADAISDYIARHSEYPIILCGDFNDSPISYARRKIAENLTDCYVSTGNGVGLSYNQHMFYVRIDNIMCSDHFQPYDCKIDNSIDASDHYPISCRMKLLDRH